jgi:hypothetical protein
MTATGTVRRIAVHRFGEVKYLGNSSVRRANGPDLRS